MKYRNLLALVIITALVSIGVSACSDDNSNDTRRGGGTNVQANPNNASSSDSSNDIFNGQTQDQGQEQTQTVST